MPTYPLKSLASPVSTNIHIDVLDFILVMAWKASIPLYASLDRLQQVILQVQVLPEKYDFGLPYVSVPELFRFLLLPFRFRDCTEQDVLLCGARHGFELRIDTLSRVVNCSNRVQRRKRLIPRRVWERIWSCRKALLQLHAVLEPGRDENLEAHFVFVVHRCIVFILHRRGDQ